MECWEKSPYQRPLFTQINNKLHYILTNHVPEVNTTTQILDFTSDFYWDVLLLLFMDFRVFDVQIREHYKEPSKAIMFLTLSRF